MLLFDNNEIIGDAKFGAAVNNFGFFTIAENGDTLFSKNIVKKYNSELKNYEYCLRSLYSAGSLNLSAAKGDCITFHDTIYAEGVVNLNQTGEGAIIFTGATTEADLREVKGGIDGTAEEILNSRTSEIATMTNLYGGSLVVEDGAILKGQGITAVEGANATIRLNNGTINESGYALTISADSGLEFEGSNVLAASEVSMADGSFLSFVLGDNAAMVDWNADLAIGGGLTINLKAATESLAEQYSLISMKESNTLSGWNTNALTVNGASANHLTWENNTLYYRPMLVQEDGSVDVDKDVTVDDGSSTIGGKDDVSIDGNGHTLTVKNAVQLVQLAMKNGTVKLEGDNNNVVSVTLDENGQLLLSAGAGLTVGNIVSMVANGSADLVVSENITINEHGMSTKNGATAHVSNAQMQTLGDFEINDTELHDTLLAVADKSVTKINNSTLHADTKISKVAAARSYRTLMRSVSLLKANDAPRTVIELNGTHAELDTTNTTVEDGGMTDANLTLYLCGNTSESITLAAGISYAHITSDMFDSVTLSGTDLWLDMDALSESLGGYNAFTVEFAEATNAEFDINSLAVYTTLNGIVYKGYALQQDGYATDIHFNISGKEVVPEPATTTLSLLALAALAARRRRKG